MQQYTGKDDRPQSSSKLSSIISSTGKPVGEIFHQAPRQLGSMLGPGFCETSTGDKRRVAKHSEICTSSPTAPHKSVQLGSGIDRDPTAPSADISASFGFTPRYDTAYGLWCHVLALVLGKLSLHIHGAGDSMCSSNAHAGERRH